MKKVFLAVAFVLSSFSLLSYATYKSVVDQTELSDEDFNNLINVKAYDIRQVNDNTWTTERTYFSTDLNKNIQITAEFKLVD